MFTVADRITSIIHWLKVTISSIFLESFCLPRKNIKKMPKKQSRNGFMIFTMDWKSKYGKHLTLSEATTESGRIWGVS